jgi:hypothetical protein
MGDSRIGQYPAGLVGLFGINEDAPRQDAELTVHDAHVLVGHHAGNTRITHQRFHEGDDDGIVGAHKLDHTGDVAV